MAEIVTAKGLRYTITLFDEEINVKENSNRLGKTANALKKLNIFKKDKNVLLDKTFKLTEIKNVFYANPTSDTSVLKLELIEGSIYEFEMTPTEIKKSNALKTQVKQIADYIQSN